MGSLLQIKASAGSGKTYELTRCFLRLLIQYGQIHHPSPASACMPLSRGTSGAGEESGYCGWEDILAVTFTNAAATEMRERVISTLKSIALGKTCEPELLSQEKAIQWVDAVMRNFGALNIRTIDSLLHLIVRSASRELRLPPDFQPIFASIEALTPYVEIFMERAWRGDAALRELLRQCCNTLVFMEDRKGFLVGDRLSAKLQSLLDETFLGLFDDLAPLDKVKAKHEEIIATTVSTTRQLLAAGDEAGLIWHKKIRSALERLERRERLTTPSAYWKKDDVALFFRKGSAIPATVEQAFLAYRTAVDLLFR
ncbi:MAG: UvrD-helicase domain-containing protein [Desulfovibrionaceae bacterium]|nr:UvrD-helicase domain-containing protein [Desulfovibrionaceae bacterium]